MKKQELFDEMSNLFEDFKSQHNGTTKRSQAIARKKINEVKKLITAYRKASVEEQKAAV